jgi:DnaK suppressor protein
VSQRKEQGSMHERNLRYFRKTLAAQLDQLVNKETRTLDELLGSATVVPDLVDQAAEETGLGFKLRIRDRELRLIGKIRAALERIEDGSFGICESCGEEIALKRLKARPVTSHCISCKSMMEAHERALESAGAMALAGMTAD